MPPGEVWRLTPAEVSVYAKAEAERLEIYHRVAVETAWLNEALARQKRLPKLAKLLKSGNETDRLTREDKQRQWAELKAICKV